MAETTKGDAAMSFQTLTFLCFMLVVFIGYWLLPSRGKQNTLLLVASLVFYGWVQPWYVLLLGFVIIAAYIAGHLRLAYRGVMIGLLFLPLLIFKYAGFLLETVRPLSPGSFDVTIDLLLPVGISFFTFQAAAYVIDVQRGKIPPANSFLDFALFLSFFPQLVAGPIERAESLLAQIQRPRQLTALKLVAGLRLAMWGAFQKLVIGDNAGVLVDKIFFLERPPAPLLFAGILLFAIQIFADFSGYTDIARGVARLLGFRLSRNFNHPYLARNPQEFWHRWHMTLSRWIRDYLYIPLGGSRKGTARTILNLLVAFTLCGLWHGAAWNFALWGLYWGLLLVLFRFYAPYAPRWPVLGGLVTFALTCMGWLIFRESDMGWLASSLSAWDTETLPQGLLLFLLIYAVLLAMPFAVQVYIDRAKGLRASYVYPAAVCSALALWWMTLLFQADVGADFIYFQF